MPAEHLVVFAMQLPSCSQCVASKTNCTGIAASTSADVPRSIVQHLESEIARLETDLVQDGQLEVVQASDILVQMPSYRRPNTSNTPPGINGSALVEAGCPVAKHQSDELRTAILSSKALQAIVSATLPSGSGAADLLSRVRMGMTPSSARVGERSRTAVVNPKANKSGSILLSAHILSSIPADIVQRSMRKYLNTIQLDNPFLDASTVAQQFDNVAEVLGWRRQTHTPGKEPLPVIASHDFLVVYLVLAISVTLGSANAGHEERCMALSVSLFEEGIQHLYSLPSFPSDIAWLQTILLVLLYATVFPRSANVWVLSGASMRSCLELGLHREPPRSANLDPETLDLRRRVFWAAYCMDRSICSALQRPLSTPDTAINAQFPALMQDDAFLGTITYHELLSEMLHVHFQREPIPPNLTWEDWLASMENRLRSWGRLYSQASSRHEPIDFSLARGLMILHRPSPRVPLPSQHSLLRAFEAASTAARIYSEHIRAGFFRRPWLSAHYTLEAGTTVLFCLRHACDTITERFTAAQIFHMTKLFTSNFLAIASGGWAEVNVYASVYERLLSPLLERVFLRSTPNNTSTTTLMSEDRFGPAQDAELMRLLYPGPAHLETLRFGLGRQQAEEDVGTFDFDLFMADDDVWGAGMGGISGEGEMDEAGQQWEIDYWDGDWGVGHGMTV
ncbi:hypothetical protein QQX98_007843 [Neonectria punicea]|uniref:Xylanolytic transcriptional activator regulatory domain-containing protein n=1 Tax=Neonectria punicea TaxID=979145 RepID=A0ABR1GWR3_9HYPO